MASMFDNPTEVTDKDLAVHFASRSLGPQWPVALKIANAIAAGKRIPQIDVTRANKQLDDNVSVSDHRQSKIFGTAIVDAWKGAAGKGSTGQQVQMMEMLNDIQSGNADAAAKMKEVMSGGMMARINELKEDPEVSKLIKQFEERKKAVDQTTTESGRAQAEKDMNDKKEELERVSAAKMEELMAPTKSFHLAGQIVALGEGCVDDEIYSTIMSVLD